MGLARKITLVIIATLVLVGSAIIGVSYRTTYAQIETSVGIETVGCANITTGLLESAIVQQLAQGDLSNLTQTENRLNWTIDHKPLFKEAFLLSLDGKILAADQNIKQRGYSSGDSFYFPEEIRDQILDMKHSAYTEVYTYDGAKLLTGYAPIFKDHNPDNEIIALMAINFDASIINERTLDITVMPFVIDVLIFLAAAIFIYFFIRRMIRPIEQLSGQVNLVAEGNLNVEPLVYKSNDEVGKLSKDFANMTRNLHTLIREVNETAMHVASSSQDLSSSAEETSKASEQMVEITQDLTDGADQQLRSLERSSQAVHDMSEFIAQIAQNTDNVSRSAQYSTNASRQGNDAVKQSMAQMDTLEDKFTSLSSRIHDLGSRSREIHNILELITEISAETNLLAMNAAIEAARAGEHGRGFAVVATSIRKLAERSHESIRQIADLINYIVDQMEHSRIAMDEAAIEVARGNKLVRSAGESFDIILSSTDEAADALSDVTSAVKQLQQNSESLVVAMDEIVDVANKNMDGAQSMSAASEEQLAAMQEVDASASMLSSLSTKLHDLIRQFKI